MSVKKIAGTVAVIVIIGAIVAAITGNRLGDWIDDVWGVIFGQIEDLAGSSTP